MPQSKKRVHTHQQHHNPENLTKTTKKSNAVPAGVIFFGLIGLGISYFAVGASIIWLIVGALIGAIGGYYFGHQIDKAFSKK